MNSYAKAYLAFKLKLKVVPVCFENIRNQYKQCFYYVKQRELSYFYPPVASQNENFLICALHLYSKRDLIKEYLVCLFLRFAYLLKDITKNSSGSYDLD